MFNGLEIYVGCSFLFHYAATFRNVLRLRVDVWYLAIQVNRSNSARLFLIIPLRSVGFIIHVGNRKIDHTLLIIFLF